MQRASIWPAEHQAVISDAGMQKGLDATTWLGRGSRCGVDPLGLSLVHRYFPPSRRA
jgi:hypothetical protein